MSRAGRPKIEYDKKAFADLVSLGCSQEEICWFFRDENGKTANIDTLSRWCKRTYGVNFQEYSKQNSLMAAKIKLRRTQFKLAEHSVPMAIWLGKQYLGQRDVVEQIADEASAGILRDIEEEIKKAKEYERSKRQGSSALPTE